MNRNSTIVREFLESVETNPDSIALHVTADDGAGTSMTYASLYAMACRAVGGYLSIGLKPGDRIILALPASPFFFAAYLGAWFSGIIPVVVAPLASTGGTRQKLDLLTAIINKSGSRILIRSSGGLSCPDLIIPSITAEELTDYSSASPGKTDPEAIAHLQCTSGSTAAPRLVIIRHRNISANILGIGSAIRHRSADKLVSWLPLYHDMGLIGFSYSLGWKCPLISSTTTRFIRNPYSWLHLISEHGGTLSPAPNSAFLACARLSRLRPPANMDLSSWRVALCGSEPVQESTILQFQAAFRQVGCQPETILPVYGLAEATLAVTIPKPGRSPKVISVDAGSLVLGGKINICADDLTQKNLLPLVSLGTSIPGHSIRIVDEEGNLLPDGEIGEIQVSGPSISDGYWMEDSAKADLKTADGFIRTGDFGFQWEEELYVSGRKKEIIIIGGRNYSPFLIEHLALHSLGQQQVKTVVAIGIPEGKNGTEMVHLLIDGRLGNDIDKSEAETSIHRSLLENCGIRGVTIHWVKKDVIPFTTSGKVQRYLCRQLIQQKIN
jgi:fatty-acyl-CoA synthase